MTTPPGMVACEIETSIDEEARVRQSGPTYGRRRWLVLMGVAIAMVLSLVVASVLFVNRNSETVQPTQSQSDEHGDGDSTQPQNYSAWSEAKVTLGSGVMYEIIEQISHDDQAFT
jgi:mannitol-specific phosphotransferase system IIBC component